MRSLSGANARSGWQSGERVLDQNRRSLPALPLERARAVVGWRQRSVESQHESASFPVVRQQVQSRPGRGGGARGRAPNPAGRLGNLSARARFYGSDDLPFLG